MANITELHEPLALDGSMASGANNDPSRGRGAFADSDDEYEWRGRDFGIWSIAWSPQGGQLIAGEQGQRSQVQISAATLPPGIEYALLNGSDSSLVSQPFRLNPKFNLNLQTLQSEVKTGSAMLVCCRQCMLNACEACSAARLCVVHVAWRQFTHTCWATAALGGGSVGAAGAPASSPPPNMTAVPCWELCERARGQRQ